MVTRESAKNTARLFISDCQANGLIFHKVFLFGSAAKDMTHERSDIDLMLISDQFSDNIFGNIQLVQLVKLQVKMEL